MPNDKGSSPKLAVEVPFEWAAQKVLGPTLDKLGQDFAGLYAKGRDKIIEVARKKTKNIDDKGQTNFRVSKDVFWNGSFTDESICAEYFGGILASSRTSDGKDDAGIYYLDIIKSLSSDQLHLHYVIYNSLNKILAGDSSKKEVNIGRSDEVQALPIWFPTIELILILRLKIDTDLEALYRKGLIYEYAVDGQKRDGKSDLRYTKVVPTTLGVHLYMVAFNCLNEWRDFPKKDFGNFEDIVLPKYKTSTLEKLVELSLNDQHFPSLG